MVGDSKIRSSAYPTIPTNTLSIQQPVLFLRSISNRLSVYTLKRRGDSTAPCLTPFLIEKGSDKLLFHLTFACCLLYMTTKSRRKMGGIPFSSSFQNSVLCFMLSKALVMSITHAYAFDP